MTIATLPAGILVQRQEFGVENFDLEFGPSDSGATQIAVLGPPRWTCAMTSNEGLDGEQAAHWRALILSLSGRVNQLQVYDLLNSAPRGTLRAASMTSSLLVAAGSNSMTLNVGASQVGKTLLKGDWIGVNQSASNRQMLHVSADAVVSGTQITVSFEPRLRIAVAAGSAVAWDKPTCLMRRNNQTTSWNSTGAVQNGFNVDLKEHWF